MHMFALPIVNEYGATARLTGICDSNPGRLRQTAEQLPGTVRIFTDLDEMLDEVPCDAVIVATPDRYHDEFIIRALKRGKDVISEKPMTINAEKCRAILSAERETGRRVQVTFNARYGPYTTKIKELLQDGIVGDVHSVEFHWHLDTVHGADYFRRWHRKKENSGGLLIHKATHHFDLVNWWLAADPVEVAALGSRQYYVSARKPGHGERCLTCPVTENCEFYMDIRQGQYRALYLEQEGHDGYLRDQCVFSGDTDIEDTMSLIVRYENRVQMTYSLTVATSFEGWQLAVNGSKGRLEAFAPDAFVAEPGQTRYDRRSDDTVRRTVDWRKTALDGQSDLSAFELRFYPLFGGRETYTVPVLEGTHGGSDQRLRDQLFAPGAPDPLHHMAGSRAGAMSLLIGSAANISMAENRFVRIADLLEDADG